tara:strand:- start:1022 stop:1963 length:942 start_codon:yes stop_codon:yes gene_type:complete
MVTGSVMAGAFFGNLADTMKENREYLKAKQGMLQDYMLKAGFQERAKLKEARAERAKLLNQATDLGLTEEASAILYSTGQLQSTVSYLKKIEESEDPDKKINRAGLTRFSEALVESVPEEKLGAAMKYAFSLGAAEDPSSDKLVEAIHATSLDEYDEAISEFMKTPQTTSAVAPNISVFDINKRGLVDLDLTDIGSARKNMERQLAAQLGGQYNAVEDTVTFTNPQAADRIIDRAETRYIEQVTDPLRSRSPNVVIDEIVNKVISLVGTQGLQLSDIAAVDYFNTMPTPRVTNPEDTVPTSADEDIIEEEYNQ